MSRARSLRPGLTLARLLAISLGLVATACGAEFDPASQIDSLRVLALKKSLPYARPGDTVELDLLWHTREPGRVPQIAWLAICENPASDLFQLCFTQIPDLTESELAERISLPSPGAAEANDHFSFTTSPDILSSRPPPADANSTPYGLHYVFFAVCDGELEARTGGQLPFVCYREQDGSVGFSAGDVQLDSRDFIVGYTAIFVYDQLSNANPSISGLALDGQVLLPATDLDALAAQPGAVPLGPEDLCIGSACASVPADDQTRSCPELLTFESCRGDCDEVALQPLIDPSNAEVDTAASNRASGMLGEQMWINYYAAGGEVSDDVRLLNDATRGFSDEFESNYQPSDTPGVSYVWAVAHDNRGGAEWARLRLCTR